MACKPKFTSVLNRREILKCEPYAPLATEALKVTLLALGLVSLSLLLQGNIGINLKDEGFLWYGAVQTASGKVPIRDFQSYDPGRYYWVAFWFKLFGDNLLSLRISVGIFQAIGLALGLLSLRKVIRSWTMLIIAGCLLITWMIPRHKVFESSLALAAVFFAFCLMRNPTSRQHFVCGIFIGVSAFFGRNHGLYNVLAFFFLILFIRFKFKLDRRKFMERIGAWIAGILLGYSPMLIIMLVTPGFFDSFVESILVMLSSKCTNISRPVPWPWRCDYSQLSVIRCIREFCTGMFFLLPPLFYISSVIAIVFSRRNSLSRKSLLIASTFVGIMYLHHIFARPALNHLAQGIAPFLIGLLSLPFAFKFSDKKALNTTLLMVLAGMTFFTAGMSSFFWRYRDYPAEIVVKYDLNGDRIWLTKNVVNLIETVKRINSQKVPENEGFLIAPHWPGFYPLLGRESPLKEIYFLLPQTLERQKEMIRQLKKKNVNWVILADTAPDNRDDLRFRNTHELVWRHFLNDFEPVEFQGLSANCQLLHRKSDSSSKPPAP
ncbi:MAG: hypothetical protein DRI01_08715 [Chloroflexi bacterium]|nr:MAG: hypothetical protein DRI01_08715 [Chloroflexota bacterium]